MNQPPETPGPQGGGTSSFAGPYLTKAMQDYKNQRYDDCLDNLKWVLFHDPTNYMGHYYQGCVFIKQRRLKEAEMELKLCVSMNQDKIDAYLKIVTLYDLLKDGFRVKQYLNRLHDIDPNSREFLKLAADRYQKEKKFKQAGEIYDKIVKIYRDHKQEAKALPFLIRKAECLYLIYENYEALEILNSINVDLLKDKKSYLILSIKVYFALFDLEKVDLLFKEGDKMAEGKDDFESLKIYKDLILEKYNKVIDEATIFISQRENPDNTDICASLNRVIFCLACADLALNKLDEFEKNILKCNPRLENIEFLLVFARYHLMRNDNLNCEETLRRIFEQTELYTPAILFKINYLKSKGDIIGAEKLANRNIELTNEYYQLMSQLDAFKEKDAKEEKINNANASGNPDQVEINSTIMFSMRDFGTINFSPTVDFSTATLHKSALPARKKSISESSTVSLGSSKIKLIGRGGFGEVWEEMFGGQRKAIKYINNEDEAMEIRAEVSAMVLLRHPNIIYLDGFFGNRIIMELAEGGSLKKLLNDPEQDLSLKFKMKMIEGITEGFIYLQSKSIVHGDMKAENVLLDKEYTGIEPYPIPKICDFGLSSKKNKDEDSVTAAGGTLPFAAPEVIRTKQANLKSDVYTFGLTIYEIITRVTPYSGFQLQEILEMKKSNTLPPMEFEVEQCKNEIVNLINNCCKAEPNERPSMEDISKEVKDILQALN